MLSLVVKNRYRISEQRAIWFTVNADSFPHTACIGLGSNLGRSRRLLRSAWQVLSDYPGLTPQILSSPYRTKPVAMASSLWFVNAVGLLKTCLSPRELLDVLLRVEQDFGRTRLEDQPGYQNRTLDLDLLFFDDLVLHSADLTLPHPVMHTRWFVLIPLSEIAPHLRHPLLRKTITTLIADLSAPGRDDVVRIDWQESEK